MNRQVKRILIEVVLGIVLSALLFFILISIGYMNIANASIYDVKFFGMRIYRLINEGGRVTGSSSTNNMMFIGVIFSVLLVIIGETFFSVKGRNKND